MSAARRRTLDKYVKEAPPSASELYQGDFWQKNHVGKREGTSASEHDCEYLGTKIFFIIMIMVMSVTICEMLKGK